MEIEKLIERLRSYTYWLGQDGPESHDIHPLICDEAADAISTIPTFQAENEMLRAELEQKENYYRQMIDALAATDNAELEQVKREMDEAREVICAYCLDIPCKRENCRWYCGPKEEG